LKQNKSKATAMDKKEIGILAEYDEVSSVFRACQQIKVAGFRKFDAFTPFPVHGLDRAIGLSPSYLPWLVLIAGISGACLAMLLMIWTSAYDYPLNVGGKPTWSIPAFIPITFEVTILFSGLVAVFGMFAINGMPKLHHPLHEIKQFAKVTDDKFFILIEAQDKKYDRIKVIEFLKETQARTVILVEA
jgi:hypothetical protein